MKGIYCIENIITKQRYIGSSINIKHRLAVHRTNLRGGYHDNSYLQNAWKKYGECNFLFFLIKECDDENLIAEEILFINKYKSNNRKFGYNIGECVISPMKGRKHSKKMKKALSEKFSGSGNPRFGIKLDSKIKEKISKSLKDYFLKNKPLPISKSVKHKMRLAQLGTKNHMYGKCGKENINSKGIYKICKQTNNIIKKYESVHLAAKANNISQGNLSNVLNGKGKTLGGFKWRFVDI